MAETQLKQKCRSGFMLFLILLMVVSVCVSALASTPIDPLTKEPAYFVTLESKELFRISDRVGSITPEARAQIITKRLITLAKDYSLHIDAIRVKVNQEDEEADILLDNLIIMTVSGDDAKSANQTLVQLAQGRADTIKLALTQYREERSTKNTVMNFVYSLLLTIGMIFAYYFLNKSLLYIHRKAIYCGDDICPYVVKIQKVELFSRKQVQNTIGMVIAICGYIAKGFIAYFYLYSLLSIFPLTRLFAGKLLDYVLTPLASATETFIESLPDFLIIAVIVIFSRYLLKLIRFFFTEVKKGTVEISGFYREWSDPTYKIIRFLVLILTIISVFPYIPGSRSPVFQGISVLFGILFSLGSSSAISNIIAGISLTYTRAFVVGDRIKVGDNIGDVLEKSLLVTRIRTIKNVDVSIPNSLILNSPIENFSGSSAETNLILHTQVTIGYDAPWLQVHKLLLDAAVATPNVLAEPSPFVFQISLDDFYVTYQINAYTDKPNAMAKTYSDLHQNIQNVFNAANMEIMSPHYKAIRNGNKITVPAENLPDDYIAPAFEVENRGHGHRA